MKMITLCTSLLLLLTLGNSGRPPDQLKGALEKWKVTRTVEDFLVIASWLPQGASVEEIKGYLGEPLEIERDVRESHQRDMRVMKKLTEKWIYFKDTTLLCYIELNYPRPRRYEGATIKILPRTTK